MIYGFPCYLEDSKRKCLILPKQYQNWIQQFNYPTGNTNIRTTIGNVFKVKIYPLSNGRYYFYNGWCQLVDSLKIPSDSWLIFHYEEALESFRILYFYQDIALAPCEEFYYKPSSNEDYVSINRSFVHHKMLNTIPSYLVLIKGSENQNWSVGMEDVNNELYIITGWKEIKNDLSLTADHLIVFEMIDLQTFHITVFNCATCDLVLPPEVCAVVKEKVIEEIVLSSDTEAVQDIVNVNEGGMVDVNEDNQIVPISFRVDGHFRLFKKQAEDLGLNRKIGLKIVDVTGDVWNVQAAIGSSRGQPRYYLQGMRKFVRDKGMAPGQAFKLNFVKGKKLFMFG
ncbi:putative transcription factor B3-Domain family [Helianthus annuus]|nr:putative transcription factor B3-Domain family [Helianthus annuus]